MKDSIKRLAIVDYGLGNIFSIRQACHYAGINAIVSSDKVTLSDSDALILPGVGAFGDAMSQLEKRDLVKFLQDQASSGKILIGICLGMQLLMGQSIEFGINKGLNIIPGKTGKFRSDKKSRLKVPQIGWNRIIPPNAKLNQWDNTLLSGLNTDSYMYFVHSYYVEPANSKVAIAFTEYGNKTYCSALKSKNIYGFQFHPERSGLCGLKIYDNLFNLLSNNVDE